MNDDFLSMEPVEQRIAQHNKALEFAKLYVETFVLNSSGRQLLDHWTKTFARKRTPVNAPHTEYAANEALRAFIEGIHSEIDFASKNEA